MLQLMFILLIVMVGYLNYRLTKSYWCNEGVWGNDVYEQ